MKPIQIISQDLFDKIRSRFSNLEMGGEDGNVTIDPADARFYDFDFVIQEQNLGRVSISINDPGSLKIYYSQGITENQDSEIKKYWYSFLREMRYFAMRRLLRFDTRDISKNNLDKNDFQYLATTKPKDEKNMNMNESRWTGRNTSKTSRRVQGKTQVIVRHKERVNEMLPSARSKPSNITSIFIQNADGERFKTPFNYLPLAFALAQHIDHGGVPYDAPAKKIIGMCEQIAQLSEFRKHVKSSKLHGDSLGIVDRAVGRLNELKNTLELLGKRRHYESWLAEFNESGQDQEDELIELSPVQFEDYKSKFTQSEFNETLTQYFPLIHSIMQEKINLEDYVKEDDTTEVKDLDSRDENTVKEFQEFEEWTDIVESNNLDISAIKNNLNGQDLATVLSEIPLGPSGSVAWAELSNIFGLDERDQDDEALKRQLAAKAETADQTTVGMDGPAMDVFKSWVKDTFPNWQQDLPELFQQSQQQLTPQPETGMQPVPAPRPGVNPNATPSPEMGMNPAAKPVAEGKNNMMQEIAETVKKFYNASNEDVGPFRSEEAVCLEVQKTIGEKYGDSHGKRAGLIAKKFMEKLTKDWETRHHKDKEELAPVDDDGLARLKELLGNVKSKVENISGTADSSRRDMAIEHDDLDDLDDPDDDSDTGYDPDDPKHPTWLDRRQDQYDYEKDMRRDMAIDQDSEDDYTDWSMRQGEMGRHQKGVAEGYNEETQDTEETSVINMFEKLVKQGRDPIDMIAHKFGWGSYELDQLAKNLGFSNSAGWANAVRQGTGVNEGVAESDLQLILKLSGLNK